LPKPTSLAHVSLVYVTVGALIDIWVCAWYFTHPHDPENLSGRFWQAGFFLTGLALMVIGLTLGQIGRFARRAELPPEEGAVPTAGIPPTVTEKTPAVVPTTATVVPAAPAPTTLPGTPGLAAS